MSTVVRTLTYPLKLPQESFKQGWRGSSSQLSSEHRLGGDKWGGEMERRVLRGPCGRGGQPGPRESGEDAIVDSSSMCLQCTAADLQDRTGTEKMEEGAGWD